MIMALRNVLITGGTGFVGSAIVRALREKHPACQVTIFDATVIEHVKQERGIGGPHVHFIEADIMDRDALQAAMASVRPQAVVHTAGFVPPLAERYRRNLEEVAFRINLEGTKNVLLAAQDAGIRAFVYTCTCCVVIDDVSQSYANIDERWPTVTRGTASIYAESKAEAEHLVLKANDMPDRNESKGVEVKTGIHSPPSRGMLTCSIRPAVIYGEGDHQLVPSIVSCIVDKAESPFRIGDGMNLWDTVYVGNVADAHVLALENLLSTQPTAAGEAFFIQNNEATTFREFTLQVWKSYSGHVPPFTLPVPKTLAWALGCLTELWTWFSQTPATLSRGSVHDACAIRYASGEKARIVLGYEPRVKMEEGLRRSCVEYAQRRQKAGHPRSNGELLVEKLTQAATQVRTVV